MSNRDQGVGPKKPRNMAYGEEFRMRSVRPQAEALFAARLHATPVDGDWLGCHGYRLPEIPATGDVRVEIPCVEGVNDHAIVRLDGVWYEWWPGFEPRPMTEQSERDHGLRR